MLFRITDRGVLRVILKHAYFVVLRSYVVNGAERFEAKQLVVESKESLAYDLKVQALAGHEYTDGLRALRIEKFDALLLGRRVGEFGWLFGWCFGNGLLREQVDELVVDLGVFHVEPNRFGFA